MRLRSHSRDCAGQKHFGKLRMRTNSMHICLSLAKNVYVIGLEAKSPRNVVNIKEEMAAFFGRGSVEVFERSKIILVEIFSDTVEPRLTTTPFIRPPCYYGHILSNQT